MLRTVRSPLRPGKKLPSNYPPVLPQFFRGRKQYLVKRRRCRACVSLLSQPLLLSAKNLHHHRPRRPATNIPVSLHPCRQCPQLDRCRNTRGTVTASMDIRGTPFSTSNGFGPCAKMDGKEQNKMFLKNMALGFLPRTRFTLRPSVPCGLIPFGKPRLL